MALVVLVIFGVVAYRWATRKDATPTVATSPESTPQEVLSATDTTSAASQRDGLPPSAIASVPSTTESKNAVPNEFAGQSTLTEEMVEAKVAEMAGLAEVGDAASLQALLRNLEHPLRAIRAAALTGVLDVASRDAIPTLKAVAARTEDPREKVKLIEVIEFLELPTLTEWRKAKGKVPARTPATEPP